MMQYYLLCLRPFLVNELELQYLFHDWREVYECLEIFGIPVPRYACVHREVPYQPLDYFVEEDDLAEVHGNHFWKPFVERPTVDGINNGRNSYEGIYILFYAGDDNRIMIYYPSSDGSWGMNELFPRQNT